ncbi:MAG TPA: hypothetical protein VM286_07250 [Candidatus Thermoplasmatota archaeon]|nr:hypothetical protein [Candidatus Thermoplasmatota archaeon]
MLRARGRGPAAALAFLAAWCLASIPQPAAAFESTPFGDSPHDHITSEAARPLGWEGRGLDGLQQAVRAPDVAESKVKGSLGRLVIVDAQGDYEPSHHCDRLPPVTDQQVFAATSTYIRLELEEALQLARSQHPERAVGALGRALHALQDCHSHSDIVDQGPGVQAAFQDALLQGGPMPEGLHFTGFQPGEKEADMPPGDGYPHGLHARDGEHSTPDAEGLLPDGRTRFEAAFHMAANTSRMLLEGFLAQVNGTVRAQILDVPPQHLNRSPIPSPGALPLLAVLLVGTLALRRRA